MVISPDILMPSLRSIPVFPTNNVEPGFSWRGEGEEIHEGILVRDNILRFPVDVDYKYLGDETVEGKLLAKISIDYHIFHYPKKDPDIFSFTGYSHSLFYWDISNAAPAFYSEEYAFMFTLHNGETVFYNGNSEGKMDFVSDITNQQKTAIMNEMASNMANGPNSGISIKEAADGIIVSLGNILFDLNQATIKKDFDRKIDALADVLRKYPQIDIIVSGHTDNTGAESFNQALSDNRAKAVADALIKRGVALSRISYIGFGSSKPAADNSTEEGRAQNRRVEIKLITRE